MDKQNQILDDPLLTPKEAAKLLGKSTGWLRQRDDQFKPERRPGRGSRGTERAYRRSVIVAARENPSS